MLSVLVAPLGCASYREHVAACPTPIPGQGAVYVADGAGDFRVTSLNVDHAVHDERFPLCVTPIEWSHGYGRIFADQLDREFAICQGRKLAQELQARRRLDASSPVYLLAHSAGSLVVLTAAAAMPPDSIERIVLLAPSLRTDYDLRLPLRAVRRSIDVYYSPKRDYYVRGAAVLSFFAHGESSPRAGQIGFDPVVESEEDARLYAKLREIPWDPVFAESGNNGGHYGARQPEFLKDFVLPLMQQP
jgi:pimeloyl-ACP methyl ester carboxylesterase